jgi:hypothetical protein
MLQASNERMSIGTAASVMAARSLDIVTLSSPDVLSQEKPRQP